MASFNRGSFNGKAAAVYYVSPTQLNVLAPADSLSGTVQVVVKNANGTSESTAVQTQSVLPGFFRLAQEYVVATNAVGGYVGPTNLVDGLLTIPAKPLETIVLWGTGFGPTNLAGSTGELQTTPTIRFGNRQAQVSYAGVTAAGLCQFNVVVPDVANGDYPVVASVGGVRTSSAARIRVQR